MSPFGDNRFPSSYDDTPRPPTIALVVTRSSLGEAFFRVLSGDIDQVGSTLDRIDRTDPLADFGVSFGKFQFTGGLPLQDDDLDRLHARLAITKSPLIAIVLRHINVALQSRQGRYEAAAANARKG